MRVVLGALCVLILGGPVCVASEPAQSRADYKLEVRSCVGVNGLLIKGGSCHVLNPITNASTVEIQVCAGVAADVSLVIGAEASVMVCGTLNVPVSLCRTAAEREAWVDVAKQKFRESLLKDAKTRARILKAVDRPEIEDFEIQSMRTPDARTESAVKKALSASKLVK